MQICRVCAYQPATVRVVPEAGSEPWVGRVA